MFLKLTRFSFGLSKNYKFLQNGSQRFLSNNKIVDDFNLAKDRVEHLKEDPGSSHKLQLYALFKQATKGKNTSEKPSMINFVAAAKWDAWSSLGDINKDEAMKQYVKYVDGLIQEIGLAGDAPAGGNEGASKKNVEGFKITTENGVLKLVLDRPAKKNAITWNMYDTWTNTLNEAATDPSVKVAVITGSGDYFCSGNDLSNFTQIKPGETKEDLAKRGHDILMKFVASFIDFPKPLIAAINGPAIGISVTTLGLYDAVYASDNASFSTPFTNLGQSAEGCSSFTFPQILGPIKAREMLMWNKKMSPVDLGPLITEIIPHKLFHEEVTKKVNYIAGLPPQSTFHSKELLVGPLRSRLHEVNKKECAVLVERWLSDECIQALTKFFTRK